MLQHANGGSSRQESLVEQTESLSDVVKVLEHRYGVSLETLEAQSIDAPGIFYVTQSPHHRIFTDGEAFSCNSAQLWQMQGATFCICFNTQTCEIETAHLDPRTFDPFVV